MTNPVVTDPAVSDAAVLRRLRDARGFIVGLDGTLALGDPGSGTLKALPGAVELLGELWQRDRPYQVFSNRTDRTPAQFAAAARDAGLEVPDARMMTPALSAVVVCRRRGWQRVMVLGTDGLIEPLRAYRVQVVTPDEALSGADGVDAVLAGDFPAGTMAHLEAAVRAVLDGAALATATDAPFHAAAGGPALGSCAPLTAAIRSVTGGRVTLFGAPTITALRSTAARLGRPTRELAVVGDDPRLYTPMAHQGASLAVAVRTGLGEAGAYDGLPADKRPHLELSGAHELLGLLRAPR